MHPLLHTHYTGGTRRNAYDGICTRTPCTCTLCTCAHLAHGSYSPPTTPQVVDDGVVSKLTEMGFARGHAASGVRANHGKSEEQIVQWLVEHPVKEGGGKGGKGGGKGGGGKGAEPMGGDEGGPKGGRGGRSQRPERAVYRPGKGGRGGRGGRGAGDGEGGGGAVPSSSS